MTDIKIISDIHLEFYSDDTEFDIGSGDVLILPGDIMTAKHLSSNGHLHNKYTSFISSCSKNYNKVIYVLGNHEAYGFSFEGTKKVLKDYMPHNFTILDNDTMKIGNWNIIGFTLWTDFRGKNPIEMLNASMFMNDYTAIRIGPSYRKLQTKDTYRFHVESIGYLKEQLKLKDNIIVVSHHAPSYRSVGPKYANSEVNSAYSSELDYLIMDNKQIKYWFHGHIHSCSDYMIGNCRVICNPVGYLNRDIGVVENKGFDRNLTISI